MPRKPVYEAVTERLEILGVDGTVDAELMPDLAPEQLRTLYREMVRLRAYDDKAVKLQRQGRMGTWPPTRGQEAAQVGVGFAMEEDDWLVPAFREHGVMLMRGVPGHLIYAYWRGDERGSHYPEGVRCFPIAVPVGSQFPHGAGLGLSLKLKGERGVAVAFGGDGSTSEGDFHEGLNFAGVFKARTVFVIQNNQWAISIPVANQTASSTLAQKAHAYGIPGLQVDGNDVLAVYAATREALDRARAGEGPTLIEAVTYRLGDHTTADEASRYRTNDEVEQWTLRDPVVRLRRYLEAQELWDDSQETMLTDEAAQWVDAQVRAMEEMEADSPAAIFEHMYAELPVNLKEQRSALMDEVQS